MTAIAAPPKPSLSNDQDSIRHWIAELTDFTPQQIESVLDQMEKSSPSISN